MSIGKIVIRPLKRVVRVVSGQPVQTVRVSQMGIAGPNLPAQMSIYFPGKTSSAPNNVLYRYKATQDITLIPDKCVGDAQVASTGTYALSFIRSDDEVMVTVTWSAGETLPVVAVLNATIEEGQKYRWEGQASADATLEDVYVTLTGQR